MKQIQVFLAIVATFFFAVVTARAQQPKSIFYMTREPKSIRSFLAHADKVDILSPNWYSVDSSGLVSGGPNPQVLEIAREHHDPVMPLVVHGGVAQQDVHKLLANAEARQQPVAPLTRGRKQ